jgi:hypothetical protein
MIYKWSIEKVTVTGDANLITHVHWRCDATEDELTTNAVGVCELVTSDSFIAYEELTEQQVLDWCFAPEIITLDDQTTVTKLLKNDVKTQIAAQMAGQVAKQMAEPELPWNQA